MSRIGPEFEMIENPADDDWVFDASNHLYSAAALLAGFDLEDASPLKLTLKQSYLESPKWVVCDLILRVAQWRVRV